METRGAEQRRVPFPRISGFCRKKPISSMFILYFLLSFCSFVLLFFATMAPTKSDILEYKTAAEIYLAGDEKIKESFSFYELNDNQLSVHDKTRALETFKYIYNITEREVTWSWWIPNKLSFNVISGFAFGSQLFAIIILVMFDKWFNKKSSNEEKGSSKSKGWRHILKGIGLFVRIFFIIVFIVAIIFSIYQILT